MAQTQLNIRVDGDDKRAFEDFCKGGGGKKIRLV